MIDEYKQWKGENDNEDLEEENFISNCSFSKNNNEIGDVCDKIQVSVYFNP